MCNQGSFEKDMKTDDLILVRLGLDKLKLEKPVVKKYSKVNNIYICNPLNSKYMYMYTVYQNTVSPFCPCALIIHVVCSEEKLLKYPLAQTIHLSLHSRHQGEGNWGERERAPAIKIPICSFLRMHTYM